MEGCPQTIDIGEWAGLRLPILLRGRVAYRIVVGCIFGLFLFEVACYAKVNQADMSFGGEHNIERFEIAKDDLGGMGV